MSVLVTITYDVRPSKRDAYLDWASKLRSHLADSPTHRWANGHGYRFFEDRERDNRFTEAYWLEHADDLYTLEDQDPQTAALMRQVADFQEDPEAVEYRVMLECDAVTGPIATAGA